VAALPLIEKGPGVIGSRFFDPRQLLALALELRPQAEEQPWRKLFSKCHGAI
jgi:hypothetical protein